MTEEEKAGMSFGFLLAFTIIPLIIGFVLALPAYYFIDKEKNKLRMDVVIVGDQHWVYASVIVLGWVISFVNMYPITFKQKIMKGNSGNIRSNPFIYKQIGTNAMENVVIMNEDGDIGAFNRANRSIHHMIENYGAVLAGLYMSGVVMPIPTFIGIVVFAIGRIAHQIGYTTGYGGHAIGFLFSTLASVYIYGILLIVVIRGCGINM
eukprot:Mrub_09129.p1 GENE.Mrub_09129~~Mrub_09129.p1  ORF type:complete len:238 (+),score=15.91 Mrub_09129:96-716(+)